MVLRRETISYDAETHRMVFASPCICMLGNTCFFADTIIILAQHQQRQRWAQNMEKYGSRVAPQASILSCCIYESTTSFFLVPSAGSSNSISQLYQIEILALKRAISRHPRVQMKDGSSLGRCTAKSNSECKMRVKPAAGRRNVQFVQVQNWFLKASPLFVYQPTKPLLSLTYGQGKDVTTLTTSQQLQSSPILKWSPFIHVFSQCALIYSNFFRS